VYWRQLDATRNSIQLAGQSYFSHNQLMNKTCSNIQEMLFNEKGINWNDYKIVFKRGACCVKGEDGWEIDLETPLFKGEGREYIERLIQPEDQ
jgi:tRNA(His) 5'-end guanylyltransferase